MAGGGKRGAEIGNSAVVRCPARGCAVAGKRAGPGGIFRLTCLAKSVPFQPWSLTSSDLAVKRPLARRQPRGRAPFAVPENGTLWNHPGPDDTSPRSGESGRRRLISLTLGQYLTIPETVSSGVRACRGTQPESSPTATRTRVKDRPAINAVDARVAGRESSWKRCYPSWICSAGSVGRSGQGARQGSGVANRGPPPEGPGGLPISPRWTICAEQDAPPAFEAGGSRD